MVEGVRSTGGTIAGYVRAILGTYTPNNTSSMAGADWEYIFSGIILVLFIWCIFRLLYALFK